MTFPRDSEFGENTGPHVEAEMLKDGIKGDLAGRDRIAWNVLSSWGSQLVFAIAGFVMPRMIDHYSGQAALGVWDFSWSLVSYFSIAGIGVGSSVNRYVARYRATGETEVASRAVSSVFFIQLINSCIVLAIVIAAVMALPRVFGARLGADLVMAQWVVGFLGTSVAIQMAFDTSRGIMTGCHRWDLHNGLNALSHGVTVAGMMLGLVAGGGLRMLANVYMVVTLLTEIVRMILAYRMFPGLQVRLSYANWGQGRELLWFGIKSVVAGISPLVVVQGCSILVAGNMGPAALAVLSRPCGLVRNAQTFLNKFSFILTPTAGSLQGSGKLDEVRSLFMRSTQIGIFLTLPLFLFLGVMGDPILRFWMGPRYQHGILMAIIAVGYFLPTIQQSALSILVGLDRHGKVGTVSFIVSTVVLGASVLVVNAIGWTLPAAAAIMGISLTAGNGIVIPICACRILEIPLRRYLRKSFLLPFLCCVPYGAFLFLCRHFLENRTVIALLAGCGGGALIMAPFYWRFLLPEGYRNQIMDYMTRGLRSLQVIAGIKGP